MAKLWVGVDVRVHRDPHLSRLARLLRQERAEGKHHRQAMLALARRRVDVLWALIRDGKPYQPPTAPAAAAA
jgi:hypothetical protein